MRAIEERKFTRLGGHQNVTFSARVIASSNVDPDALVQRGEFRRDLLYRINIVTLTIRRCASVPRTSRSWPRIPAPLAAQGIRGFDPEALQTVIAYSWPGNVRELPT